MFRKATYLALALLLGASSAWAQVIDQALGVDQSVNYRSLTQFGPWDDRNYQLTQADLDLLSADEAEQADPIPAFFRVELRREFPHLRTSGPAQYPRAAVPLFYKRYAGLIQDGAYVDSDSEYQQRETEPAAGAGTTEIQLSQVQGANEVTVEINPANPMQAVAGSNNNGGQEMYYSTNGGASWTIQGTLPNTCCDPTVDWKSDGSIAYVAALSGAIGVSFWRSFDGGQTWVDRYNLTSSGSDKEFIHVDRSPTSPYQDNIYLTYHNGNTMQFARSGDDGETWSIQAFSSDPRGIGSDITTTNNGDVYNAYGAFTRTGHPVPTVELLKSTDGGVTFAPAFEITTTNGDFDWPIPAFESRRAWVYTAVDADRSGGPYEGSVYVAFTDTTAPESGSAANNHTIIEVWYSRDGGATWNVSHPHAMDDTNDVDRFNQWLTVDESGKVHVVFYDTRHFADRTGVDLYYNVSSDGGVTWGEPQRVTSVSSPNLTGGQEWGDYNGLSVLDAQALATWTDNRGGPPNNKHAWVADIQLGGAALDYKDGFESP